MPLVSGIPQEKSAKCRTKRSYVRGVVVPFEEDFTCEFKGHRNLGVEDIPKWCYIPNTDRRSRRAVSRNLNGFINTGKGGTVYLGIIDDGTAKGIHLSRYQKDHIMVAMKDLMGRYKPPVDSSRYKIEFVPLVGTEGDDIPEEDLESSKKYSNRLRSHLTRTPDFCWCDKDALSQFNLGLTCQDYIIEITILPYEDQLLPVGNDEYRLHLHPVHQDEEGNCYFKRQASAVPYTWKEVKEFTIQEVRDHYIPIIESLQQELYESRKELAQR